MAGIAVAGGIVAAVGSAAAPTTTPVDSIERALLVAAVAVAGSRARRWSLIVLAALVATGGGWASALGLAALVLALVLVETGRRDRVAGALVGALAGIGVLLVSWPGPTGLETVVLGAAVVAVLASGYRRARSRSQELIKRAAIWSGVVLAAAVVLGAIAVAVATPSVQRAASAISDAVAAARDGEGGTAAEEFRRARDELADANRKVGSWWAAGARVVPVMGPNFEAVRRTVAVAEPATAAAARVVAEVDLQRAHHPDGGVDLEALLSFGPALTTAAGVLDSADADLAGLRSPWLASPLAERLAEVRTHLGELRGQTALAEYAVREAPPLLGADAPRRYLVLLGNPAELRDLGGHVGNWAELVVDRGRLDLVQVGAALDLATPLGSEPPGMAERHPASLLAMQPGRYPQNWSSSPDVEEVAPLVAELFSARTGRPLDGVVYADAAAFAGFVALTGPVPVEGLEGFQLTSRNAERFVTRDQYGAFPDDESADDALRGAIEDVFERLTTNQLPSPQRVGTLFAPLVDEGRFQVATLHEGDRPLLRRFGVLDPVRPAEGVDAVGVLNRNVGPNKLDAYLERSTQVRTEWRPGSGEVSTVVSVRLRNGVPDDVDHPTVVGNAAGVPPRHHVTDLVVTSPHPLRAVLVDGLSTPAQPQFEDGMWRHTVRVVLPPGSWRQVDVHLAGEVPRGSTYRLELFSQPLVQDQDPTRVRVLTPSGPARPQGGMQTRRGVTSVPPGHTTELSYRQGAPR